MKRRKRAGLKVRIERWRVRVAAALVVVMALTGGCFLDHDVEQFYGLAVTPRAQEFRWSDGGLPQVFDPALAAAPPDTDAVRALYEGLTEYDPKTLAPVPGVAARWESSADARVWTFHLRRDARWSNDDPVTAQDFVRSWRRTLELGDRAPHARLLRNIEGVAPAVVYPSPEPTPSAAPEQPRAEAGGTGRKEEPKKEASAEARPQPFGAEVVDDYTLRVRLQRPDPGFAALASHPVFRPVHKLDSLSAEPGPAPVRPVSNGAFQLTKVGHDGVVLERAKNYWDAGAVSLQRVQFVPAKDAEAALAAYRAGEVDAVTNAGFEPLALKLLAPYRDFRRATFGALTYYSFNTARPPFDDVRVREALSMAIDRDRISQDELGGATEPAKRFLPAQLAAAGAGGQAQEVQPVERDVERARSLLAEAGYPLGQNFPKVRLLVNRNAQQRQVAGAVAEMWRSALNVETEIIQKDWAEYEIAFREGDYDVARRSYVMQAADESASLRGMFEPDTPPVVMLTPQGVVEQPPQPKAEAGREGGADAGGESVAPADPSVPAPLLILSEAQALRELPAMPIYFARSYALVKPYVVGFDANLLDAPSLKHVRLDTSWQPPKTAGLAWFK